MLFFPLSLAGPFEASWATGSCILMLLPGSHEPLCLSFFFSCVKVLWPTEWRGKTRWQWSWAADPVNQSWTWIPGLVKARRSGMKYGTRLGTRWSGTPLHLGLCVSDPWTWSIHLSFKRIIFNSVCLTGGVTLSFRRWGTSEMALGAFSHHITQEA